MLLSLLKPDISSWDTVIFLNRTEWLSMWKIPEEALNSEQKMIFSRFYKQDEFSQGAGFGTFYLSGDCRKIAGQNRTVVGTGERKQVYGGAAGGKATSYSDELQVPFGVVVWRIIIRLRINVATCNSSLVARSLSCFSAIILQVLFLL